MRLEHIESYAKDQLLENETMEWKEKEESRSRGPRIKVKRTKY